MSSAIKLYSHYEGKLAETLTVTPLSKNSKNSSVAYVHDSSTNRNPEIQLCDNTEVKCMIPFGISSFDEAAGGRKNMEITLRSERLVNFIQSIDEFNIATALKNKKTWFPKIADAANGDQQIRDMYHRLLTLDTSGKGYPPRCHTKTSPEELTVTVLDELQNTMTQGHFDDVQKRSEGMPIVHLVGYWFQPRQWGLSMVTKHFLMNKMDNVNPFPFVWSGAGPPPVMTVDAGKTTRMTTPSFDAGESMMAELPSSEPTGATGATGVSVLMASVKSARGLSEPDAKRLKL